MKNIFITALLLIGCCAAAMAETRSLDYAEFRALPILEEGRVKPLDTYARLKLKEFSGQESVDGMDAAAWLAETIFDPADASERRVFAVENPALKERLGLEAKEKLFSGNQMRATVEKHLPEIAGLLQSAPDKLTPEQAALVKLHNDILDYNELQRSLSFILPLNVEIPEKYKKNGSAIARYLDFMSKENAITDDARALVKRKGEKVARYNANEQRLATFAFSLREIRAGGTRNENFKIVPVSAPMRAGEWESPWRRALSGDDLAYLKIWRDMADDYRTGDTAKWEEDVGSAVNLVMPQMPKTTGLEIFYNGVKPFRAAFYFYLAALGLATVFLFRPVQGAQNLAPGALTAGLIAHGFGIAARVIVLGRPPVGTLYEAVLFVSFICTLFALGVFIKKKSMAALLPGLITAAGLLLAAPAMLQKGESMEMLVAVLNTNFWLSTHVLCITTGYATSIICACLAHVYLISCARNPGVAPSATMGRGIQLASVCALFFTAVGTALGGIWADQSWGRFWGWDPKENGALLIVLWIVWLQHGRFAKKLGPVSFAAGAAFLNVVVALAWFGVNLLSVGLHSYGFTAGIAAGLGIFCAAEIVVIGGLWLATEKKFFYREGAKKRRNDIITRSSGESEK